VRVLICDDEPDVRLLFRTAFEAEGVHVEEAGDGREAVEVVSEDPPDLVVLDLFMPEVDGLEALPKLRSTLPDVPILVVSAHAAVEVFGESRARGATACFDKVGFHVRIPEIIKRYGKPAPV
jgi:CheY-like chemotaxis protein